MWEVEEDGRVRRYSERMVRRLLEDGRLTGAERARVDGGPWGRLCDTPLFADAVPTTGDPRQAAQWRLLRPLATHLVAYVGVNLFLVAQSGDVINPVLIFWGIGVIGHALKVVPQLRAVRAPAVAPAVAERPRAALPDPGARAAFHGAAEALLEELAAEDEALAAEVRGLDAAGAALAGRIRSLRALVPPHELARLTDEEARLAAALEVEPGDADVRRRELASLRERLEVTRQAKATLERLEAEERALVHQVEGLRLALLQARAASGSGDELVERVRALRERAAAEAEVDAQLAAARRRGATT